MVHEKVYIRFIVAWTIKIDTWILSFILTKFKVYEHFYLTFWPGCYSFSILSFLCSMALNTSLVSFIEIDVRSLIFVAKKVLKFLFGRGKESRVSQNSPRKDAEPISISGSVLPPQITPVPSFILYRNT